MKKRMHLPLAVLGFVAGVWADVYAPGDLVLPKESRVKVDRLAPNTARCVGLDTVLKQGPADLLGHTVLTVGRGRADKAFEGYALDLKAPAVLYLFAAKVGETEWPPVWSSTGLSAQWTLGKGGLRDLIYRGVFPAGRVEIPGHGGFDGGRFAIPHLVVVVPPGADVLATRSPEGVRTPWPVAPPKGPVPSAAFDAFARAPVKGPDLVLPDFSYAGYDHGRSAPRLPERRFLVTDYGARPDDLEDDGDGIQRAILAAGAAGGGVVFLPRGRWLVNTRMDRRVPIRIEASGVVVKGEGCGEGGTILHQIHPFETGVGPMDPRHYHLGETVFDVHSVAENVPFATRPVLATVVEPVGTHGVRVADPGRIRKGGHVFLMTEKVQVLLSMIAPHEPDDDWVNFRKAPMVGEIHRVREIQGDTVLFEEPLRYPVKKGDDWVLKPFTPIIGVGFEDLAFMGQAHNRVVHHRNDLEDSGWAPLKMKGVADGWVRRCAFIDVNQTVSVNLSTSVSLLNLFMVGNPGHHIPRVNFYCHGVLGGLLEDRAHFVHGPSVSQKAVGTVYWRCRIGADEPLDSHSGRPFLSLYDRIDGGSLYGSTGGLRDFPQHLGKLVVWNLNHGRTQDGPTGPVYDFWKQDGADVFYRPLIVGLHGAPARFHEDRLELLESLGTPVTPESLYEAQLALRLGAIPRWVEEARADHERLSKGRFPPSFDRRAGGPSPFLFPETFRVKDLLGFVTSKAMRVWGTETNTFTLADESLTLRGDQNFLRHGLYAGLAALFAVDRRGHEIAVTVEGGDKRIVFEMKADGVPVPPGFAEAGDVADAKAYIQAIGGRVQVLAGVPGLRLEVPR